MSKICITTKRRYEDDVVETHWINLDDFTEIHSFKSEVNKLFRDEENPQMLILEAQNIPCIFIKDKHELHPSFFSYNSLPKQEKGMVDAYYKLNLTSCPNEIVQQALTFFYGKFPTKYSFLCHLFKEQFGIKDGLEYINFELFEHDIKANGYYYQDGYVFCV